MTTFETLIENSYKFPFCFTVAKCRDDRKMIWVNDKFFELTGYSKEKQSGETVISCRVSTLTAIILQTLGSPF